MSTRADRTDILRRRRGELPLPKWLTEEQVCKVARVLEFPVVVKNGNNGQWYLKGKGKTRQFLEDAITKARGQSREGVYCLLLD